MKKTFLFAALCFALAASAQNRALQFDGVNDYVSIPEKAGVLTTSSFTAEMWVRPAAAFTNYYSFLLRKTDDPYSSGVDFYFGSGGGSGNGFLEADLYGTNAVQGMVYYDLPASWTAQWHHVALVYNGTNLLLYVDGVEVSSMYVPAPQATNGAPLYLGAYDNAASYPFNGTADELRIWNVARNQAEIQANRNTEIAASTPNLAAYYKMDQGTAGGGNGSVSSLTDYAAGNNGTLTNFSMTGTASNFVTGNGITVLALKDASFTATRKGTAVQLDWKSTASEEASSFAVEGSADGARFAALGIVTVPARASETALSYTDAAPPSPVAYYRIKTTDPSGRVSYSQTLAVVTAKTASALRLYPNPASLVVQVQLTAPKGPVTIEVKDLAGRAVQTAAVISQGTTLQTRLDVSQLPAGLYAITAGKETSLFLKQ